MAFKVGEWVYSDRYKITGFVVATEFNCVKVQITISESRYLNLYPGKIVEFYPCDLTSIDYITPLNNEEIRDLIDLALVRGDEW